MLGRYHFYGEGGPSIRDWQSLIFSGPPLSACEKIVAPLCRRAKNFGPLLCRRAENLPPPLPSQKKKIQPPLWS